MPEQIEVIGDLIADYMRHTHGDRGARRLLRDRAVDSHAAAAYVAAVVDVMKAYLKVCPPLLAGSVRRFGLDVPAEVPDHACVQAIVAHGAGVFVRFHEWQELAS